MSILTLDNQEQPKTIQNNPRQSKMKPALPVRITNRFPDHHAPDMLTPAPGATAMLKKSTTNPTGVQEQIE
jgi:hypothetical protein